MSRIEAEQLLESEPMGTFLVRLSEKIWGYAISYKDVDRCKHYLINASTGQYKFLGANQMNHTSLSKFLLKKNFLTFDYFHHFYSVPFFKIIYLRLHFFFLCPKQIISSSIMQLCR